MLIWYIYGLTKELQCQYTEFPKNISLHKQIYGLADRIREVNLMMLPEVKSYPLTEFSLCYFPTSWTNYVCLASNFWPKLFITHSIMKPNTSVK